jgi:hypothetical protein
MFDNFKKSGVFHREGGPALTEYTKDGIIIYEIYYIAGMTHREDGHAHIEYCGDGRITYEAYYKYDMLLPKRVFNA